MQIHVNYIYMLNKCHKFFLSIEIFCFWAGLAKRKIDFVNYRNTIQSTIFR